MTRGSEAQPDPGYGDIRPVVAGSGDSNRSVWIFAGVMVMLAIALFAWLNGGRTQSDPALTEPGRYSAVIASPPPLTLPHQFDPEAQRFYDDGLDGEGLGSDGIRRFRPIGPQDVGNRNTGFSPRPAVVGSAPAPSNRAPTITTPPPSFPQEQSRFAPLFPPLPDNQIGGSNPRDLASASDQRSPSADGRVSATRLASPSMTVPQGTVIPAVLETALDSTRGGAVRAIVSRDVRGFDGERILIPRGSRLYGEYDASLEAGQRRALIAWKRLTRPDGAIIALDSPASDPLGRAGVEGKVNSHFVERFGGAILQSVLDAGVGIATRRVAGDGVVVALPGSTQNITGTQPNQVQRTLTVRHGTSVSVFVARDLDFSPVER